MAASALFVAILRDAACGRSSELVNLSDDLRCVAMVGVIPLSQRFGAAAMTGDELFPYLPVHMNAKAVEAGDARLREPVRDQVELRALDLDSLIGPAHPARTIWD